MEILALTVAAIAIAMLIMAVGAIFKRRCLRGSCGGPRIFDSDGETSMCASCGRRDESQQREQEGVPADRASRSNPGVAPDRQDSPEMVPSARDTDRP